jgi:hypothetical protein
MRRNVTGQIGGKHKVVATKLYFHLKFTLEI